MENKLPPKGIPKDFYKDYSDCQSFHSSHCGRPDCKRCFEFNQSWEKRSTINFLAAIKAVAGDRPKPEWVKQWMAHFDPNKNACAKHVDWDAINLKAKEL
jgi:hypothetical protein